MVRKKRVCKKGYSCGATCIAQGRVCRKALPDNISSALDAKSAEDAPLAKAAKKAVTTAPEGQAEAYAKREDLRSRYAEAEDSFDFDAQIKLQKELLEFIHKRYKEHPDKRTFTPIERKEPTPELISEIKAATKAGEDPVAIQARIYAAMGYNAKPDLVDSREALYFNENIAKGGDGLPMVLYRGVNNVEYQDALRGGSDIHFVGSGKVGNGTYAAGGDRQDMDIYSSSMADAYGNDKIAFGIKEDSKFFREADLDAETQLIAKQYGLNRKEYDTGLLMALGGWDAYLAKGDVNEQNEYVVLNRSAMVISKENITESFGF